MEVICLATAVAFFFSKSSRNKILFTSFCKCVVAGTVLMRVKLPVGKDSCIQKTHEK